MSIEVKYRLSKGAECEIRDKLGEKYTNSGPELLQENIQKICDAVEDLGKDIEAASKFGPISPASKVLTSDIKLTGGHSVNADCRISIAHDVPPKLALLQKF